MSAYQEYILNAPDVCNNCFASIRRERDRRRPRDGSNATVHLSAYTRVKHQTEVGHGPGDEPTQCTAVWCACGVESAYERIWDDGDDRCLAPRRLKDYIRNSIRSLERKGVTLDRKTTISLALHYYRDGESFNEAMETAIEAGIQTAAATPSDTTAALSE